MRQDQSNTPGNMNKDQLIDKIVDATKYSKNQVKECFEKTFDIIIEALKKDKKVSIVGFGNFRVVKRKGRKGVDPRSGKGIKIQDIKIAKFKTGKRLKEAVK